MDVAVNSIASILGDKPSQIAKLNGAEKTQSLRQERSVGETALSPAKKFEAMVMSQMVADIMPKDSEYFGDGFSGDVWRSMMSDQIAQLMVKSADFGIAELVTKDTAETPKTSK
ncbi:MULTISPECIES: rod-binding protein [Ahrensia]|jgi:Rod binding domain-containing protein|uniref:Rod-binding protein n=1 Tax=Ahrensia kielensis TaxID=76980 RepID=A0ABU9T8P4_9HYPH|nr:MULTISPECIES: rod-binding protein [Ahrensia]